MDTARVYCDEDGNECSIWQMLDRCPKWAASRVQEAERLERIAAEADALMSRMGAALAVVEPRQLNEHQRKEVSRALREYNQYKDQTND